MQANKSNQISQQDINQSVKNKSVEYEILCDFDYIVYTALSILFIIVNLIRLERKYHSILIVVECFIFISLMFVFLFSDRFVRCLKEDGVQMKMLCQNVLSQ